MPAERPVKTGIHNLVELDIANTLDFHIASTDFMSIINDYIDYVAIHYIWTATKHTGDPITSQAEFFHKLNSSLFNLPVESSGIRSMMPDHTNYDIIDLNTYLEPNEIWVRSSKDLPIRHIDNSGGGEPRVFFQALNLETDMERMIEYIPPLAVKYTTLSSFLLTGEKWATDENGIPKVTIISDTAYYTAIDGEGNTRNVTSPPVIYTTLTDKINELIGKLNDKFGCDVMTDEFLYYWYEKYKSAHFLVKEEYKKLVGDDYTQDYFTEFNDSIGGLGRLFEYPDGAIIPITDITFERFAKKEGRIAIPRTIPPNVFDKLDKDIKFILLESSRAVNSLFRLNIVRVVEEVSTSVHAHGSNLATDHLHYFRIAKLYSHIAGIISDTLGVSYRILGFTTTADNTQAVVDPKVTNIIETHKIQVDFLKTKITALKKNITTKDVLGSTSVDVADLG